MTHVVDSFLPPQGPRTYDLSGTISGLVRSTGRDSEAQLKEHIVAALRTRPPIPGVYRTVAGDSKKDRVYMSFAHAGKDVRAQLTRLIHDALISSNR